MEHPPPAALEETLTAGLLSIRDPQERLNVILATCSGEGIPEAERREPDLVPGCVSRVWLTGRTEAGALRLRWDAESPLVRGLAGLVCQVYDGAPPDAVAPHRSRILSTLGLDRSLSPTRLRGLAAVERRIHDIAAGVNGGATPA